MKRILSILTALMLFCMGWVENANAQPDVAGRTFTLQCARGYVKGNGTKLLGTANSAEASEFALVPYHGNSYLYDATNKVFVMKNAVESNSSVLGAIRSINWGNTGSAEYPYYLEEGTTTNWMNMDGGRNVVINGWKTKDDGNQYKVEIVDTNFDDAEALNILEAAYLTPSVKIVNGTNGEAFYGSWNNLTWTSYSGLTMTLSDGSHDKFSSLNGRYNLAYQPATANTQSTLTLTAPAGYIITGYSVETGVYQGQTYTLTSDDGTSVTPANLGSTYTPLDVYGLNALSTSITITTTDASKWLSLANFTVALLRYDPFSAYYGEKWVRILGAGNTNIAMGISSATNGEAVMQKTKDDGNNGQLWCLVGDSNSFKMYNKLSGTTLQLASNSTALQPSNGTGTAMRNPGTAGTDWKIVDKLDASNPGWGICYAGSDGSKSLNAWSGYANDNNINYYSANDGNSHWVFEPATLPADPSGLEKNSVYALYCAYTGEGEEYPLYNNDGVPNVSDNKATTPQMFVLSESGKILSGAYLYNLQKAEGDGYLSMGNAASNRQSLFTATEKGDYLFLNSASTLPDNSNANGTRVDAPYFHFYGWYTSGGKNFYPTYRGPYRDRYIVDARSDNGNNVYGTTSTNSRTAGTNNYNYRWKLVKQPYSVYNLMVRDASGNVLDNVQVSYKNSSDAAIQRAPQANGGIFVIKDDVTPTAAMFKSADALLEISNVSIKGKVVTVEMTPNSLPSSVTTINEGRYVFKNRGRNKYLTQSGDVIGASNDLSGGNSSVWDVVASPTSGQYFIRNVADGRYIQWVEAQSTNFNLVESAANATRVVFSTEDSDLTADGKTDGCVAIKNPNGTTDKKHFHMDTSNRLVRWETSDASDWYFYPVEYAPEEDVEFLIQNTRSNRFVTWAGDNAQMIQTTKGNVNATASVWNFLESGDGYKMTPNSTTKYLGDYRACRLTDYEAGGNWTNAFTDVGVTWYIRQSPSDATHYAISQYLNPQNQNEDFSYLNDATTLVTVFYDDSGSIWRFIPVDVYYLNALAYLDCLYDAEHKNDLFYITEAAYNSLTTAAHSTSAEKIAAANAMYNVLSDYSSINMPEDGKDYLIKNSSGYYMNTIEDGAKLNLKSTDYNSSFFWHVTNTEPGRYHINQSCYGTAGGEFPSADKRYINNVAGMANNNTAWTYVSASPSSALTLAAYVGEGYTEVLAGNGHMHGRYDLANSVLTWNDRSSNNNRWEFVPVDEASVGLLNAAAKAIANGNNGAFTLTPTAIAEITTAKANLEANYNYVNYYILEKLLNASDNYFNLESGRYLVRNYEFDTNGDGTPEDPETWLTSMVNPVGSVEEVLGYWSIWDITSLGHGQYTMVNEGNSTILAPTQTVGNTDEGKLYYKASTNSFQVGTPGTGDEGTLVFYPAASLSSKLPVSASVSGNYAAITVPSLLPTDTYMCMATWNDRIASYAQPIRNRDGQGCYWQFIPIQAETQVNHEGRHSGEAEMFANEVNGLAGYVGGVVTLENVGSVAPLNDIVQLRDAAVAALKSGSALSYTSTYDHTTTTFSAGEGGAKAFKAIMQKIERIKNGTLPAGYSQLPVAKVKKLYQDLRPTEIVEEVEIKHPFFLENMSGLRPAYGARLTEGGTSEWICQVASTVTSGGGTFYVTRESGEAGAADALYSLKNANGDWLAHGSLTKTFELIQRTQTEGDRMNFYIDPVIPGVWQIRDAVAAGGSNDTYVTISSDAKMRYYRGSEISSLWKFRTFNELDTIFLKQAPDVQYENIFFCTFSYPLNIQVPVANNPKPYYCSKAYRKADHSSANLKVEFSPMPDDGTYYYLEGNQGYLFMAPEGSVHIVGDGDHRGQLYIANAEFLTGKLGDEYKKSDVNLLVPNLYTLPITRENWASIYALSYASSSTQVGSYCGEPVMGVGTGFYHIRVGGKLNPGTAYLPSNKFVDGDVTISSSVRESGMPAEMSFLDEDGNLVDAIEVLPDGTWEHQTDAPLYDLAGRRVTKPTRGIYIQNGRKVMYK